MTVLCNIKLKPLSFPTKEWPTHMVEHTCFQDPVCYYVELLCISIEIVSLLTDLLLQLDGWILKIDGLTGNLYNLNAFNEVKICDIVVGQSVSQETTEFILNSYRKQRSIVIGNNASNLKLITNPYRIAVLSALEKRINEDFLNINQCKFQCVCGRICNTAAHFKRENRLDDYKAEVFDPEELEYIKPRSVPQRQQHNTTPVQPNTEDTESKISNIFGTQLNPNINYVFPQQPGLFNKPLFSPNRQLEEDIKYSVQVSDPRPSVDGYHSSLERTFPIPREHPGAEIVTNVSSVLRGTPGLADNRRIAESGYQDTARGASGNSSSNAYYRNTQTYRDTQSGANRSNGGQFNNPQNTEHQLNSQRSNYRRARHPEYASYRERLQSFSIYNWNETTRPSAKDLIESGLFATDRGDLVRCFQCGLGLKDWAKDDDPLVEHVKYATDCDFLTQTLGLDKLIRFKDALNPSTTTNLAENNEPAARNPTLPYAVRSPRYMALEDRMNTFLNFPPSITQSHRDLALAGLYYTGEEDICRCFTCDGGLKNWVPGDDPMEEHAKYFPQCPYLRHIKGDSFVELVRQRMQAVNVTTPSTPSGHVPVPRSMSSQGPVSLPVLTDTSRQSLQARRTDQDQDVDEILRSPVGRSILQTGYSVEVVKRAIKQLLSRGIKHPSAQQTMELILDYEENGVTPSVHENNIVNGASNETNGDEDVLTENEKLKALMKCILCKTRERNILCIPCSHHRMCQDCARNITHCPTCGKYIEQKVKTYMS